MPPETAESAGRCRKSRTRRRALSHAAEKIVALALRSCRRSFPDMALNACELEIDLFCHGMVVGHGVSLEGARSVSRTRAGLGSGLEIAIPTGSSLKPEIWVNVPIEEPFARHSPY